VKVAFQFPKSTSPAY